MKQRITIKVDGKPIVGVLDVFDIEVYDDFTPVGYKVHFTPDDVRYPECFARGRDLQTAIDKLPQKMIDRQQYERQKNERMSFLTR